MSQVSKITFYKLPCGCVVACGTERIVEMCGQCSIEFDERHERAVEDRRRQAERAAA